MWSTSNDYGLSNIAGSRPLGSYTEQQRQIKLIYEIARQLTAASPNQEIFGSVDPKSNEYEVSNSSPEAAMAYGLKPYIVAPKYDMQSLVSVAEEQATPVLHSGMQRSLLHTILHHIVENA